MINERYWKKGLIIEYFLPKVNDPNFKKYHFKSWRELNETVEFSKGNRDYIAGFKPDWAGYGEVPVILSPKYKIAHKDGSLIITDWDYDTINDYRWKKFTYVCNKETGLTFHRGSNK